MAAIFQTTSSNGFSWMKMFEFRLTFHWSLFPGGPINNIPTLVQVMAWRRPGDKPLSEPMTVRLPINSINYVISSSDNSLRLLDATPKPHNETLKMTYAKLWLFVPASMGNLSIILCLICSWGVESFLCAIDLRHAMTLARVFNWTNHHTHLRWQNNSDSCQWKNNSGDMPKIFVLELSQTYWKHTCLQLHSHVTHLCCDPSWWVKILRFEK